MLSSNIEDFLSLVRWGIGHNGDTLPEKVDWKSIQDLATDQGLAAVVLDGLDTLVRSDKLSREQDMEPMQKKMWIGQVLQNYECRYDWYLKAISELASFYNEHGFKMMVLKGFACSLDWPKPEHRPSGDIDIWLFGHWKEADAALSAEKGIRIDSSHHHHTVFGWNGFTVENHYDFINVYARKLNAELEKLFKELGADESHFWELNGERIYLPSANLHALFLIRHAIAHFAAAEITLRQVLDWAFFVEKNGRDVDWKWLLKVLDDFGMRRFFDILNGICIENLGFDSKLFPNVQFEYLYQTRVLEDILQPEFNEKEPSSLISRAWFRYRRWQANAWKQELCYKESRWSAFWSGVWNHLLKPSSI